MSGGQRSATFASSLRCASPALSRLPNQLHYAVVMMTLDVSCHLMTALIQRVNDSLSHDAGVCVRTFLSWNKAVRCTRVESDTPACSFMCDALQLLLLLSLKATLAIWRMGISTSCCHDTANKEQIANANVASEHGRLNCNFTGKKKENTTYRGN